MAADVSKQIKSESKSGLKTRDFLGGSIDGESKELDLDLHVPSGWEKRLDLKSGKVYIQRCSPANSPSDQVNLTNLPSSKHQDLNSNSQLSSSPSTLSMMSLNLNPTLNLLEDRSLELKLMPNCSTTNYTSVCTLDKVRSALDRVERASSPSSTTSKKRWMITSSMASPTKSSSSLSNSSTLSVKEANEDDERLLSRRSDDDDQLLVAAACPVCFLYVLISKSDPKCPKCTSFIQVPLVTKKPKIDLNMSM